MADEEVTTFTQAVQDKELNEKLEIAQKKLGGICLECGNADDEHKFDCSHNYLSGLSFFKRDISKYQTMADTVIKISKCQSIGRPLRVHKNGIGLK